MDMWNSRSDFTAQSSSWCGSGFTSRASSSAGAFRRSDPGLRRWRSMYHLEPESPTRSLSPFGAEMWTGRGERSFRQGEVLPWLHDAHERLNTKLDRLRTREVTLGHNKTVAQRFDMKQKLLSKTMDAFSQDELFERSQQCRDLQEKVRKLENELLHVKSSLVNVSEDQLTSRLAASHKKSKTPGDVKKQEKKDPTEVDKLREALREAEARAAILQEERNKALQDLQTSAETQKMLINKMEEMEKRVSDVKPGRSEVQNHLGEENSKISFQVDEQSRQELEVMKKHLAESQHQLQELNEERMINLRQITDQIREKENLLTERNPGGYDALNGSTGNINQRRTSTEDLDLETQKLQNQCVCLEEKLKEKEKMLQMHEKMYQKKDEMRRLQIKELEDLTSHWTQKWQNVALNLQSTQEELEELKRNCTIDTRESESLLRPKQETGKDAFCCFIIRVNILNEAAIKPSSSTLTNPRQKRFVFFEHKGAVKRTELLFAGSDLVQTLHKDTQTDLSESSLTPDSTCSRNKSPQLWAQSGEVQRLKQKLSETEREVSEREHDLRTMERLREMERAEAQIRISALELKLMKKAPEVCQNGGGVQADVSNPASTHEQQDEWREKLDETQQVNPPALHKHPNLRQKVSHSGGKNETLWIEDKKNKTICHVDQEVEQQRRMVTEQLKSLFKEREGKAAGRLADAQSVAQSGSSSTQDWTPTSLVVRAAADRRSWQPGSALMPVLEEDEEDGDWSGVDEGDVKQEAHTEAKPSDCSVKVSPL
ncbi:bicaudal D-related protein 1 isoform X2 [Poecilia reticulata]|uniref:bicaudal D-related protein 1 isoform X2 n=1 Tax=Poecilia reticulata TaxID=8081 RepID=UPI0004A29C23|nr:PREDICTED: bicaudal D-related protein 1-like isoform X2 [Poecilia reticulata]